MNQQFRAVPQLGENGASPATVAEVLFLSVPFTLALTVPMAVFLSVCWVFTRLAREGTLASTRRGFERVISRCPCRSRLENCPIGKQLAQMQADGLPGYTQMFGQFTTGRGTVAFDEGARDGL